VSVIVGIATGTIIGLLIILLGAPVAASTDYHDRVSNMYLSTAMQTLRNPAFVVSNTTNITLQSRSINQQFDREELPGDPGVLLRGTRNSTVRCGKRACTFVDQKMGVCFDLRDVVVFDKLSRLYHNGALQTYEYQRDENGTTKSVEGFVRAVARVDDTGERSLDMDLDSNLRKWIDGNEDGTAWHRVWKGVERMFAMRGSALSWLKSLVPVLAWIAGLFAAY